jgi:hypothetical protein
VLDRLEGHDEVELLVGERKPRDVGDLELRPVAGPRVLDGARVDVDADRAAPPLASISVPYPSPQAASRTVRPGASCAASM